MQFSPLSYPMSQENLLVRASNENWARKKRYISETMQDRHILTMKD